jgi:hypothetical protein
MMIPLPSHTSTNKQSEQLLYKKLLCCYRILTVGVSDNNKITQNSTSRFPKVTTALKYTLHIYKACSKKDRTFAIKNLLLTLQHFKYCPLQSNLLYWRYTFPNVSFIVGMHFLWSAHTSLIAFSLISYVVWKLHPFKVVLSLGNRKKSAGAKSGEQGGWGTMDVWCFAR